MVAPRGRVVRRRRSSEARVGGAGDYVNDGMSVVAWMLYWMQDVSSKRGDEPRV